MTELKWDFTVVRLDVGVAKFTSYWMQSSPNVHWTRFVSFLCGIYVVIMWPYVVFLCEGLILWSTKKIVFVLAGISDSYSCASRVTSLTLTLSHSCPSLILSDTDISDGLPVSLLMAAPVKCNQGGVYVLGMGECALFCWRHVVVFVGLDSLWLSCIRRLVPLVVPPLEFVQWLMLCWWR